MATTPDQIPNLKVNMTLAIPSGETSERPLDLTSRDEANIRWNKTFNDFDIFVDGRWERLLILMKLHDIFMTKAEFYDQDVLNYLLALHEDVNNLYLEVQAIRVSLGLDLMAFDGNTPLQP